MKKTKNVILKLLMINILLLLFVSIYDKSYAYQIVTKVVTKEQMENQNWERPGGMPYPNLAYRKQVAAYTPTVERQYNNRANKSTTKWDYNVGGLNTEVAENYKHDNPSSFTRAYEYFHKDVNSWYLTTERTDSAVKYYGTGISWITDQPRESSLSAAKVTGVSKETDSYKGVYASPANLNYISSYKGMNDSIVKIPSNIYRYALVNGNYISDNELGQDTVLKIVNKFGIPQGAQIMSVYQSSVLRTAETNNTNDAPYANNMDTSFKVFKTLNNKWGPAPALTGIRNGKIDPSASVINYFDNTFEIPIKNDKEVYIRHIDISGISSVTPDRITNNEIIKTNGYRAMQHSNTDWEVLQKYIHPTTQNIAGYSASFSLPTTNSVTRFANLKYMYTNQSDSTFSSLDDAIASNTEKEIRDKYNCVGIVIGKGETLQKAEENRDNTLRNIDVKNIDSDTGSAIKGTSWSSTMVYGNDASPYIVIDFYYQKNPGEKQVYVRHIDLTDYLTDNTLQINSSNVNQAISNKKILSGIGKALRNSVFEINKDRKLSNDYQEKYTISPDDTLQVFRDPDENYSCIGSNMTTDNKASLGDAKSKMNIKLNSSNKYDSWENQSRITTHSNDADVVLIDFYYINKNRGTVIEREKVGRLAFYTGAGSDIFSSTVNNYIKNNNTAVIDKISSNENLMVSIDNAYVYMLGGIRILQQTKEGQYDLNYNVTQKFRIKYKDWSSSCGNGHWEDNKRDGTCGVIIPKTCYDTDDEGNSFSYDCSYSCANERTSSYEYAYYDDEVTRQYTYTIPYNYTYYKVQNLRMYTISKIELLDGYANNGLPLFDGQKHTINTTDEYKKGFSEGSEFISSIDKGTIENGKTLTTTFEYEINNNDGDISQVIYKGHAMQHSNEINKKFDLMTLSDIAKIQYFKDTLENSKKYEEISTPLKAELYVKNDEIKFIDKGKNENITLVGEEKSITKPKSNKYDSYIRSEKDATMVIDLATYTKDITTAKASNTASEVEEMKLATVYPLSVNKKYTPENKTDNGVNYYNTDEQTLHIPETRLNGKRFSLGKIYYNLLSNNNNLNFDVKNPVNGQHNWSRTTVDGATGDVFIDTEMYNEAENEKDLNREGNGALTSKKTTMIFPGMLSNIIWEYGEKNNSNKNADIVNVFTPIAFNTKIIGNDNNNIRVDHTTDNKDKETSKLIQKNTRFEIEIDANQKNTDSPVSSTSKYISHYYINFDFDVQDIVINDAKGTRTYVSNSASKDTWIGPIYNKIMDSNDENDDINNNDVYSPNGKVKISGYALADPNQAEEGVINQETNNYEVRAVAVNVPISLDFDLFKGSEKIEKGGFVTSKQNEFKNDDNQSHADYYDQDNIYGHSNYIASVQVATENINRLYDFKVTDVKDVDWKNIFRTSTTTTTNVHSGKAYYSGVKKWNIYTTSYNELLERTTNEIGVTNKQILPVGPYKHTTNTYTKAPKLGYKFSFDLKTTGANTNKEVIIRPSFYYISKDGQNYNKDIELYYKNSSNRYINISNYKLYFVPDDGYRLTFESTDQAYRFSSSSIANKTVLLGKTTELKLTDKMMEQADKNFVQIWYGEYKLPNSTIVVKKGDNINNRLTGGYIGVKFDITVNEKRGNEITRTLNYNQNNNNATNKTNTTQWDYEGYIGFKDPGNNVTAAKPLSISLEKGDWVIDTQDKYEEIKGTVMLYDTDARASSDYD